MPSYPFLCACCSFNDWLYWCSFSSLLFWCLLTFDPPFLFIYMILEHISTFLFALVLSHLTYTSSWNVHHMLFFSQFKYYCCFLSDKLNIYLFFSWFVAFTVSILPVPSPPICISTHSNYPSLYEKVTCVVTPTFPFPGQSCYYTEVFKHSFINHYFKDSIWHLL